MKRILYTLAVAILFATSAFAKIIRVPADQPTIQAAINAAAKGDTVLVADGTYFENINFKGKAITVASHFLVDGDTTHVNNTIINGSKPSDPNKGSVVSFVSGEDTTSVIYGFTITGGTGTLYSSIDRIGGGIYYENSGARIAHNKITANSITNTQRCWGGGIGTYPVLHDLHQVIIEDNVIESNAISGNDRTRGGGICLIQGKVIRNKIRSNSCSSTSYTSVGGGVFSYSDTTFHRALVIIEGNTITHNQVTSTQYSGTAGGVDIQLSNVQLIGNVISQNKAGGIYTYGCGIRIVGSKAISIVKDNTISFNSSVKGNGSGGGLFVNQSVGLAIQGNRFEGNKSSWGGGIFGFQISGSVIFGNKFIGNIADTSGGGLDIRESNNSTITGNFFKANHAKYGGGMLSSAGNYLVTNNIFIENTAHWGGGMYCFQLPTQSYFTRIINNTITGNVADTAGAIASLYGKVVLMNTICWGNSAPHGQEIEMWGGTLNAAHSDIRFGADGIAIDSVATINWLAGNIDEDPRLAADSLSNDSKCIGSGTHVYDFGNGIVCNCPDKDFNGRSRPYPAGTRPDMGAWESTRSVPLTVGVESQPGSDIPKAYSLHQNYPNPFNPSTAIEFALPQASFVTLKIYDLLGKEVATLVAEKLPAGKHQRVWEAKGLASGVYLYRLEAGDPSTSLPRAESRGSGRGFVQTKKLILLR